MLFLFSIPAGWAVSDGGPPVDLVIAEPGPVYEGSDSPFSASATDPDGGEVTFAWTFGDGGSADGADVEHAWADDGDYDVTAVATDDEGDAAAATIVQAVLNAPPSIDDVLWSDGLEGAEIDFVAVVSDPGTEDTLVVSWEWADGTEGDTGAAVAHVFSEPGEYEVTVTVEDDDGDATVTDIAVTVANAEPRITSSPGTRADQDVAYTYAPSADDGGSAEGLSWTLDAGPDGAAIDAATGVVTWTPTYEQCGGVVSVAITVSDGDGGSATQSWSIDAVATDSDGDGMPDDYEDDVGHDAEADDADEDPDEDGASNLAEYRADTDPFAYEGPGQPVNVSPADGVQVSSLPTLSVANADNGRGLAQSYVFTLYADAALASVAASSDAVAEGAGTTAWTVTAPLDEDATYWWTAVASDDLASGEASAPTSFQVNDVEAAPPAPVPTSPLGGDLVATLAPTLTFTRVGDPEGSAVTYDVQVLDAGGATVVAEEGGLADAEGGEYQAWSVEPELAEDTFYQWRVRATDASGNSGDWSDAQEFLVSTADGAPGVPSWIAPLDGDTLVDLQPALSWTETADPEGMAVTYAVQGDVVPTFDSAEMRSTTLGGTGAGTVTLDLAGGAVSLPENTDVYLRVRAVDPLGISSDWSTIRVYSRGDNDPPEIPELRSPPEGTTIVEGAIALVAAFGDDPEGDAQAGEMWVSASADGSAPVAAGSAPVVGAELRWEVEGVADGTYYWSARAVDELGAASEWAPPVSFTVDLDADPADTGDTGVADDSGSDEDPGDSAGGGGPGFELPAEEGGCGCASRGGAGAWGAALVAAAVAGRRKGRSR